MQRHQEALDNYDILLKYKPNDKSALYGKAVTLGRIGKHKEAAKIYPQLWDKETLDKYYEAIKGGEHFDLNGQHVVVIRPKDKDKKPKNNLSNPLKSQSSSK